tara:strand:+ start:51 stop:671 length:621 start_codon:yes stop_codon:yes gene_type:complete
MAKSKNTNSILFLFEGETEGEFYKIFFDKLPKRKIRISPSNLKGVYGLNNKVRSKIVTYLKNSKFDDCNNIHVYVAYDREGIRSCTPLLDKSDLVKEFVDCKNSRVASINEIIATQDLESWLFYDLEGIYKFLKVPKSKRKMNAYPNTESVNNNHLSALFHRYDNHYQKGSRVEGFLNSLDMEKIYGSVNEIQKAIKDITNLIKEA